MTLKRRTPTPPSDGSASDGIQVFAAPSDAPRVRWKTDLISAAVSAALAFLLMLVAGNGSSFDDITLEGNRGLSGQERELVLQGPQPSEPGDGRVAAGYEAALRHDCRCIAGPPTIRGRDGRTASDAEALTTGQSMLESAEPPEGLVSFHLARGRTDGRGHAPSVGASSEEG